VRVVRGLGALAAFSGGPQRRLLLRASRLFLTRLFDRALPRLALGLGELVIQNRRLPGGDRAIGWRLPLGSRSRAGPSTSSAPDLDLDEARPATRKCLAHPGRLDREPKACLPARSLMFAVDLVLHV
jgi:hypothetical protein